MIIIIIKNILYYIRTETNVLLYLGIYTGYFDFDKVSIVFFFFLTKNKTLYYA